MEVVIGAFLGMLFGYFMIKSQMDKRLYMILSKSGMNEQALQEFMAYYRNYNKIQKEADKKAKEKALSLEVEYRLAKDKVDSKAQRL